jgi:hypothetical protein
MRLKNVSDILADQEQARPKDNLNHKDQEKFEELHLIIFGFTFVNFVSFVVRNIF